jgi:tRNA-2-methylthio-N6-dimethylallyladenosine synthase
VGNNAKKRANVRVSQGEMVVQKQFIEEIKEMNYQAEMKNKKKKAFYISTFGCQMNENDSEKLTGMLEEMGYIRKDKLDSADLVIFNTCCVRENAEEKVFGHLGALKGLKRDNEDMVIVLCGCMMQQKEIVDEVKRKYKHVDIVFGTHNIHKFPGMLFNYLTDNLRIIDVWESDGQIIEGMPISRKKGIKAWVSVMFGCNNFCSYCVVPYVRGRERSRNHKDILDELRTLAKDGYKEITLLGQNVNSYGADLDEIINFALLLKMAAEIEGIERIRFMTSHPKDLSDELIRVLSEKNNISKHIHLPLQSGSSRVLKDMNRHYTKEDYLVLIKKIKESIPCVSLTTDIIVGFPGETEEDFEDTLDVMSQVRFDMAYTFIYSKRTGTPAAKREDQVDDDVKSARFKRLLELQNKISREINNDVLNKEVMVLVEGISEKSDEHYAGRTDSNKIVNFKTNEDMIGKMVKVRIDKVQTWSLGGFIVTH